MGKYRVISGTDEYVVKAKAQAQLNEWDHLYAVKSAKERAKRERQSKREEEAEKKQEAADRSAEAEQAVEELKEILKATLNVNDAVDWEKFKSYKPYSVEEPRQPIYRDYPPEPLTDAPQFQPSLTLFDKMIKARVERKQAEARALFESAYEKWAQDVETIKAENDQRYKKHVAALEKWHEERLAFEAKQQRAN
ncbi:MAG TPA: hypothetical protein VKA67_07505, partial [Verrucomicrobiae bacterium]|nr:hypothetical protein [Verrucomicrobiae bacterium]